MQLIKAPKGRRLERRERAEAGAYASVGAFEEVEVEGGALGLLVGDELRVRRHPLLALPKAQPLGVQRPVFLQRSDAPRSEQL